MVDFNVRLREALSNSGVSQQQLADRLNIGKSLVSLYVSGQRTPNDLIKFEKIAKVLDVNPAWLAGFDEPVKKIKLSDTETKLIEMFRELGEANQNLILSTIKALPKEEKTNGENIA